MAINFKRGLFRIWLALSLVWIGLTGWKEYYNKPWNMDWGPGWRVGDECWDRLAPLGFSGGVRGTPGQTGKRALAHQETTDLCANTNKTIDGHTAQENRFMQGGRPTAGASQVGG
jgi:hypothetical protein